MKIEKDAEWLRLEGKVGQLRGDLATAERRLSAHRDNQCAKQLDVVPGETVILSGGRRYLVSRVDGSDYAPWVWVRAFYKDGSASNREQRIYGTWTKEAPCAN